MMIHRIAAALALAVVALAARAVDFPVPKVMADAPPDKGSWRMEMLEMSGAGAERMKMMGRAMTVCQTAAQAMSRDEPRARRNECKARLVEDSAARAVVEATCPGDPPSTTRSTITRAGLKAYDMAIDQTEGGRARSMRMRMSYAGPCSANDGVVALQKDSPACRKGAAQMAAMDPDRQCKGSGREQCLKAMADARARLEAICR